MLRGGGKFSARRAKRNLPENGRRLSLAGFCLLISFRRFYHYVVISSTSVIIVTRVLGCLPKFGRHPSAKLRELPTAHSGLPSAQCELRLSTSGQIAHQFLKQETGNSGARPEPTLTCFCQYIKFHTKLVGAESGAQL